MQLSIKKDQYSELVIRKALYWIKAQYQWSIEEYSDHWLIIFICDEENFIHCKSELNKLLNDYSLREKLDSNTDELKIAIIRKALKDLSKE